MSNVLLNDELVKSIDDLTQQISEKIIANQLDGVKELLDKRLELLASLVSSASTETEKEMVTKYFIELQRRDSTILHSVEKEHELIKRALANLNNLKQYVTNGM